MEKKSTTSDSSSLRDGISGENDAFGITAFVYKDSVSGEAIMVDCGASPAMKSNPAPMIAGLFAQHKIKNVCLSHGHFDHMNGLHVISDPNVTVHMSHLTGRYVRRELRRHGVGSARRLPFREKVFVPVKDRFTAKEHLSVGPFKIVPILVPHSIAESCMLLIMNSDGSAALHQGDAKLKGMDWQEELVIRDRLSQIGEFGLVDVMHVDNLNCHRPGFTPEESGVCASLTKIVETTKGRVVIGVFATNLRRIKAVATMAMNLYGRDVEFVGASMRFAKELLEEEGMKFPSRRTNNPVVFTSGCQGEPESILWREAEGVDSPLGLGRGDTVVFSSHRIPGNEKRITATVENLLDKGCRVIVNKGEVKSLHLDSENVEEAFVHVSGHGQREDVETVLDLVRPKIVIPSINRGPQIRALRDICSARSIKIVEPEGNCFTI